MSEWQPIETCPKGERVLLLYGDGRTIGAYPTENDAATHWAPLPVVPEPDPMTVVAWHPMEKLPNEHPKQVLVRFRGGLCNVSSGTMRYYDADAERTAWCPLAPLLDLIPEDGES